MPSYDLVAVWERHLSAEMSSRDVHETMATMVDEPYVNHVPVMTGGSGHKELTRFYKYHFLEANPADLSISTTSRTVGEDQIVDEIIVSFTHDRRLDYMLPGIAPTGRKVEIPIVVIVHFKDGKLAHEHIYWDQASLLVQVGLLDPNLFPVAGVEAARKVSDPRLPANQLMHAEWAESEGKPL